MWSNELMTSSETLYAKHIDTLLSRVYKTGNWSSLTTALQRSFPVPAKTKEQVTASIAEHIADSLYFVTSMKNHMNSKMSLGELILFLDKSVDEFYSLAQLSRNRIDEFSDLHFLYDISAKLQLQLSVLGIECDRFDAYSQPEPFLVRSLRPIKNMDMLYQWANSQDLSYYDIVLDINKLWLLLDNIDKPTTINVSSELTSFLDEACAGQGLGLDDSFCER